MFYSGHQVLLYDIRPPLQMWQDNSEDFCRKMASLSKKIRQIASDADEELSSGQGNALEIHEEDRLCRGNFKREKNKRAADELQDQVTSHEKDGEALDAGTVAKGVAEFQEDPEPSTIKKTGGKKRNDKKSRSVTIETTKNRLLNKDPIDGAEDYGFVSGCITFVRGDICDKRNFRQVTVPTAKFS